METLDTKIGTIIIREAIIEDALKIIKFMNWVTGEVSFNTYGAKDYNISIENEIRMINVFHERENSIFYIALYLNEIIGIATSTGLMKKRIMHRSTLGIIIAKRYWRLGIGIKMMKNIIEFSRINNITTKLELLVHERNYPAINLYKKIGFNVEGINSRYFKIDGKYFDGINMVMFIDR